MKGLSVSKDQLTEESDFECTYCSSTDSVLSCRVGDSLELLCEECGRYGEANHSEEGISSGPFFKYGM